MLATTLWLGGLAVVAVWILPAMQSSLEAEAYASWQRNINQRLNSIGWFSMALLLSTGLVQMGANSNYSGLLSIANNWAAAILIKHIFFFGMVGVSAYITWSVNPALERAAILRAGGKESPEEAGLLARLQRLIGLNLGLGVVVLVFTALARIA